MATVVPQAFERLVQLLQALQENGAAESVGLSIPGLATLLGQQAPTRYEPFALLPSMCTHHLH